MERRQSQGGRFSRGDLLTDSLHESARQKRGIMDRKKRLAELKELFASINESERSLIENLLSEVVYLEEEMEVLRTKPFLNVHPKNPTLVRQSPAAKLYKECSQSYMNAIRILLTTLRKADTNAQDELLRKLEEFSI